MAAILSRPQCVDKEWYCVVTKQWGLNETAHILHLRFSNAFSGMILYTISLPFVSKSLNENKLILLQIHIKRCYVVLVGHDDFKKLIKFPFRLVQNQADIKFYFTKIDWFHKCIFPSKMTIIRVKLPKTKKVSITRHPSSHVTRPGHVTGRHLFPEFASEYTFSGSLVVKVLFFNHVGCRRHRWAWGAFSIKHC